MQRIYNALLIILMLSGCSSALPEPQAGMAWISINPQPDQQLSARRLDNKPVTDARYFQVDPGKHQLELFLAYPRNNMQMDGQRRCEVIFSYVFQADAHYSIKARTNGWSARAWLYDATGRQLIESRHIECGKTG